MAPNQPPHMQPPPHYPQPLRCCSLPKFGRQEQDRPSAVFSNKRYTGICRGLYAWTVSLSNLLLLLLPPCGKGFSRWSREGDSEVDGQPRAVSRAKSGTGAHNQGWPHTHIYIWLAYQVRAITQRVGNVKVFKEAHELSSCMSIIV